MTQTNAACTPWFSWAGVAAQKLLLFGMIRNGNMLAVAHMIDAEYAIHDLLFSVNQCTGLSCAVECVGIHAFCMVGSQPHSWMRALGSCSMPSDSMAACHS